MIVRRGENESDLRWFALRAGFALTLTLGCGAAAISQSGSATPTQAQATAPASSGQTASAKQPAPAAANGDTQQPTSTPPPPEQTDSNKSKKDCAIAKKDAKVAAANKPIQLVEPGSEIVKAKPGSIEDVNAVGNRNIGGRGLGNWYSTDWEIRMGHQYSAEIDRSAKFITDPVVTEYVNRIGQNIVKNSDAKVPFTIKVIDSDEINAFALPGGFFYVNSGLILNADEEAELAGVMAHEIAHVAAHHAAREMTRMNYAQIGTVPLIFLGGMTGYELYEASSIAVPMTFLHFSREFESQADFLGIEYMYRAGYDPQAFVAFFEKIQALEKRKPGIISKAFADHPQTPARIENSQAEIAQYLPAKPDYLVTTSEFDDVKARLALIENKRRLRDPKNLKRPSLRKASAPANGSAQPGNAPPTNGDDQPTLQRRPDDTSSTGSSNTSSN
uniref:Peptidase M48, Ste24p n=1 Tax=mine drainage metagenome TaxID=410659 RepID=E6QI21_9ZZZZ